MAIGRKTGGRAAGTPNKDKAAVEQICARYGFEPIEAMIFIHKKAIEKGDFTLAGKMAAEIAKYVHSQKKATEFANPEEQELVVRLITVGQKPS
ncbi:MAG: hypothetical protein ABSG13_07470 [Bryobacteraceae bacterium]